VNTIPISDLLNLRVEYFLDVKIATHDGSGFMNRSGTNVMKSSSTRAPEKHSENFCNTMLALVRTLNTSSFSTRKRWTSPYPSKEVRPGNLLYPFAGMWAYLGIMVRIV